MTARARRPSPLRLSLVLTLALFAASAAGAAAAATQALAARPNADDKTSRALRACQAFIREEMDFDRLAGLAVGVWMDDKVWTKGFGLADIENDVPVRPESSFRLGSVSKTFTALAVLQLVEAGKINLDKDVRAYVPYFPRKKWPFTVRQLLGHLAGISHYRDGAPENHIKEPKTTREAIAIFQDFDLVAQPGTRYSYSTYGYNLLGAVVEAASGEAFGDYLRRHILDPLAMTRTRLDNPLDLISGRVRGYQVVGGVLKNSEYVDISSRFGGAGMRSTVPDLIRYVQGLTAGRVLGEKTTRLMWESQVQRDGRLTHYGLGWNVEPWHGHFRVYHGGSQPETRTLLILFPAERFALALASNSEYARLGPYALRLAELLRDEDFDCRAYTADSNYRLISRALETTFSYGLSQWQWNGRPLTDSAAGLGRAFEFFSKKAEDLLLGRNVDRAAKDMETGIDPVSGQALTAVGSFMAATLAQRLGRERLSSYYQSGPAAFFGDYIRETEKSAGPQPLPRFGRRLEGLILSWEKDWTASYTESIRGLHIARSTDFPSLRQALTQAFQGRTYFRDFSPELAGISAALLDRRDEEKAEQAVALGLEFYVHSPFSQAAAGFLGYWKGDLDAGRAHIQKAWAEDAAHPATPAGQFLDWQASLRQAGKTREALALIETGLDFYPEETDLLESAGDACLELPDRVKAARFYERALAVNPDLRSVRVKLKALD